MSSLIHNQYSLFGNVRATAQWRNPIDEIFIVARRPAGVRPGKPSTLLLGLRWNL